MLTALGMASSWISPLANLLAVPLVGLLAVPAALLGVLLLEPAPGLALPPLQLASWTLSVVHVWLDTLARVDRLLPAAGAGSTAGHGLLIAVACALLLAPLTAGLRLLGLPLLLAGGPREDADWRLRMLFLDVGQGQAVVVATPGRTLLYDAGPRYSVRFEAGGAIVVPALRWLGRERIDLLLLSHGDADHAGGLAGVLERIEVAELLLSPDPRVRPSLPGRDCAAGESWRWDGIDFELLHPPENYAGNPNDRSCVLRIDAGVLRVLLPGDIEAPAESALLSSGAELAADLLMVPHHGSRSSSTAPFLARVAPRWAIVSAGFGNRWGHPHAEVSARYDGLGARLLHTGKDGAVLFELGADGTVDLRRWRRDYRRYWFD
jgi:competence protein ComEC